MEEKLDEVIALLKRLLSETEEAKDGIKAIQSALTDYGVDVYGEYGNEV